MIVFIVNVYDFSTNKSRVFGNRDGKVVKISENVTNVVYYKLILHPVISILWLYSRT